MTYSLWRGDRLLGQIMALPEHEEPSDFGGSGQLVADALPADLVGSMQMRMPAPTGFAVMQFPVPTFEVGAAEANSPSSTSSVSSAPGRTLDASTSAAMRDDLVLSIRDQRGRVLETDLVSLSEMLLPEKQGATTRFGRTLWLVGWSGHASSTAPHTTPTR